MTGHTITELQWRRYVKLCDDEAIIWQNLKCDDKSSNNMTKRIEILYNDNWNYKTKPKFMWFQDINLCDENWNYMPTKHEIMWRPYLMLWDEPAIMKSDLKCYDAT